MDFLKQMTDPYDKFDLDKIAIRDAIFKIVSRVEELEKRLMLYTERLEKSSNRKVGKT
jgi:hypothetical protein